MNVLSKRACLLAGCILLVLTASVLFWVFNRSAARDPDTTYTAYLYQDGQLLQTIPLSQVTQSYCFTLEAPSGGYNIIEVSTGAIAITEADCPDQICVLQGAIADSLLPITCLPHRLVIELRADDSGSTGSSPDAFAY